MAARRPKNTALVEAQRCFSFALRKATRNVTRAYDAALRKSGLRSTQFNLLVALDDAGPISSTELAERLVIERTTLTRNLALLAAKGWVQVAEGKDRRSRRVSITEEGRRAALQALPAWRRVQADLTQRLGDERAGDLVEHLNALMTPRTKNRRH